jgi:hypothetical protein
VPVGAVASSATTASIDEIRAPIAGQWVDREPVIEASVELSTAGQLTLSRDGPSTVESARRSRSCACDRRRVET